MKLKDVPNLLPEKINKLPGKNCKCAAHGECECGCGVDWTDYTTYNQAIDQIGNKEITINREELAVVMYNYNPPNFILIWDEQSGTIKNDYRRRADAIISNLPTLLESKGE